MEVWIRWLFLTNLQHFDLLTSYIAMWQSGWKHRLASRGMGNLLNSSTDAGLLDDKQYGRRSPILVYYCDTVVQDLISVLVVVVVV